MLRILRMKSTTTINKRKRIIRLLSRLKNRSIQVLSSKSYSSRKRKK